MSKPVQDYHRLINYVLGCGNYCAVIDEDKVLCEISRDRIEIISAIESTKECQLSILDGLTKKVITTTWIIPSEIAGDQTIYDYYRSSYMDRFWEGLEKDHTI